MLVAGAVYDAEFGLIVKWLKVAGWARRATAPWRSWSRRSEPTCQQSEDRGVRAGRGQPEADARGALDDAGGDLDQSPAQRGELGGLPIGALGRGGAQRMQEPIGGGMKDQSELVGA